MTLGLIALLIPLLVALGIAVTRTRNGDTLMLVVALCLVVLWLRVDHRFEGAVLVSVTPEHGLHVADVLGLAVAGLACALWLRARLRPRVPDRHAHQS